MKYRVKVIQSFIDKYTGQVYAINQEIDVDEKRGEELLNDSRGLVELVAKIEDKQEEGPEKKKGTGAVKKKTE